MQIELLPGIICTMKSRCAVCNQQADGRLKYLAFCSQTCNKKYWTALDTPAKRGLLRETGLILPHELPIDASLRVPETSTRNYSTTLKQDNQYVVEWHAPDTKAPAHATIIIDGIGDNGGDVAKFIFERDLSVFFDTSGQMASDEAITGVLENWDRQLLSAASNAVNSRAYASGASVQLLLATPELFKIVQVGDIKTYLYNEDVFNNQQTPLQSDPHLVRLLEERERLQKKGADLGFFRWSFFGQSGSVVRIPNEDILLSAAHPNLVTGSENFRNQIRATTRLFALAPEELTTYLAGGDVRSPVTRAFGIFGLKKDLSYMSYETIEQYDPNGIVSVRPAIWTFTADEGDDLTLAPNHNYFVSGSNNFWKYVEADSERMEHTLGQLLAKQDQYKFASVLRIKLDSLVNLMEKDQVFTNDSTLVSITRVYNDLAGKRPTGGGGGGKRKKS